MTHEERLRIIHAPFPTRYIVGKSWAGTMVSDTMTGTCLQWEEDEVLEDLTIIQEEEGGAYDVY